MYVLEGGTSSRGDGGYIGVVHQSRPVYQGVVSHHPISWLPYQPRCHQDADQSGREGSPWLPDQPAAWDSPRTHTSNNIIYLVMLILNSVIFSYDSENNCVLNRVLQALNVCFLLKQGYDNTESSVRKACVFCLVAIYTVIGEDLKPHLSQLSSSKVAVLRFTTLAENVFPLCCYSARALCDFAPN